MHFIFLAGLIALPPATALAEEVFEQARKTRGEASVISSKPDRAYGAYQRGLYLTAFDLALPRAKAGDAAAQTLIAELYDKGLGIARDTKEAAAWYGIAANSGNREAQFSYAMKLLAGKDLPQDRPKARKLMQTAADAGHPLAMYNFANMIIEDRPTSAGYRKAMPYFEKAAELQISDAYYALSQIYKEGRTNGIQYLDKARYWLEKAARAGMDTAQIEFALELLKGDENTKDEKQAFSWLSIAANAGNVIAQNRLAHMLLLGIGVKQSPLAAAKWHILARRAGRTDLELDEFVANLDEDTRKKAVELANRWPSTKS